MGKMITSRDFNQNVSGAKRLADKGPVVITDRGTPAYVLMRHEEFKRLSGGKRSIVDMLHQEGGEDFDFDPPKLGRIAKDLDLD